MIFNLLPFASDPSLGRSNPWPTFIIFFRILLSPKTSMTFFHETSSRWMVKFEFDGQSPSLLQKSEKYMFYVQEFIEFPLTITTRKFLTSWISTYLQEYLTDSSAFSPFLMVFNAFLIAGLILPRQLNSAQVNTFNKIEINRNFSYIYTYKLLPLFYSYFF